MPLVTFHFTQTAWVLSESFNMALPLEQFNSVGGLLEPCQSLFTRAGSGGMISSNLRVMCFVLTKHPIFPITVRNHEGEFSWSYRFQITKTMGKIFGERSQRNQVSSTHNSEFRAWWILDWHKKKSKIYIMFQNKYICCLKYKLSMNNVNKCCGFSPYLLDRGHSYIFLSILTKPSWLN